jgi:hypothetical protein
MSVFILFFFVILVSNAGKVQIIDRNRSCTPIRRDPLPVLESVLNH